ncbi:BTB/POZ domain-containing protein POB1 [Dendrobium catenatum]|uniref:BTB/POZ domain-containing protein POB1 n=2 Tax=Dendrobium TaxID=37818 RepID=A0A2I0WMU6_9ASPA|nr:BTB/POZ domain-containing protein POB1 [Dendrobium catenatum]
MDPDFSLVGGDQNFEFAFNSSNFSDRVLRIEIVAAPAESKADGDCCASFSDWARHRKRRREDIKKDKG